MKRLLNLLAAVTAAVVCCSCSLSSGLNMDEYRYDGYQNVQWGSEPEQVIYQMEEWIPKAGQFGTTQG